MSLGYRFTSLIRPQWAPEKGSVLTEVVVASLILSIAIVGVALMFSSARSMVVAQGAERVAFYLAQEKLENQHRLETGHTEFEVPWIGYP